MLRVIREILYICEVMKLNKQFAFFTYLIESYAGYQGVTAQEILKKLDEKELTDFVYNMYEMYHTESINNAFLDLDSLLENGNTAWK